MAVRAVGFRDVLAVAEFRALFSAQLVSVTGDQLARVALSILVYDRTNSPGWAALTYALTFLPDLVGGPLLSGLADRYPPRAVLVSADVLRALAVAVMAWPGLPLPAVAALLIGVQLLNPVWNSARAALLPQVLPGERFVPGMGLLMMLVQAGQVAGFALGGLLVAGIGTGGALLADAASFAVSALFLVTGVRSRPPRQASGVRWWRHVRAGWTVVVGDRRRLALVALGCVSGIYIAGEAIAAPYAAELGGGAVVVGLLLGAYALGNVLGMAALSRVPPSQRARLLGPLAVLACAALLGCALRPNLAGTLAVLTLSGVASSYNLIANTTFVQLTPDAQRAQAFGFALTALRVSQGLGVVLAGVAAERVAPHGVVAGAGAIGVVAACGAALLWRRAQPESR
ncbi:Predicted arabinose efflux permease, MFS family [Amycolatopsis pretoriensis]|uniref:Predicted arabinose efflux permease, MFS family n=1 Tax=Amycolatopsis pretoriensis TaxID=218821 RepID=A0A1H5RGR4_9PSEU|nr:MFS transporter [Amycolatopsis pretoriensis]SEF37264.1 Predicted arabinose efflux permease, MFS family [Amycolatopsis pretoriensis]